MLQELCRKYFVVGLLPISAFLLTALVLRVRLSERNCSAVNYSAPPSFFDGVLRSEDFNSPSFKIYDPLLLTRGRPFFPELVGRFQRGGPTDLLGFRNRYVPASSDIVVIGDSLTFGSSVTYAENWPVLLEQRLGGGRVYNMSLGSWGPLQYLASFQVAHFFRPQIILVVLATGSDAPDAFITAYGSDAWTQFRLDPKLSLSDLPRRVFPPPEDERWQCCSGSAHTIEFIPSYRLFANDRDQPTIDVGFRIIHKVIQEIVKETRGSSVLFTIIPSKELVYAKKVEALSKRSTPAPYLELVKREQENIVELAHIIGTFRHVKYIDLLESLQRAALQGDELYGPSLDGHPYLEGQQVIASALSTELSKVLPTRQHTQN